MGKYKIIHDVVHGSIKLDGVVLNLAQTPELNRLHNIKQLGLVYLVFPGAHHTRFEHSLGVSFIAKRIAEELKISEEEKRLVEVAGLLHDVGHGPYSHTLEYIFHDILGIDHMQITKDIITGDYNIIEPDEEKFIYSKTIPEILEKHDISPKKVADLVTGNISSENYSWLFMASAEGQQFLNEKNYLSQIIHGSIDADQLDYLLRDSYYSGVAHGTVDIDRLLKTMEIFNNDLIIHKKGIPAVEGMLVARGLMYSSVYFHKTVRIAETMISRAVESLLENENTYDVQRMVDSELMACLRNGGSYEREIAFRLKYRNLYKKAHEVGIDSLNDDSMEMIAGLANPKERRRVEDEICRKAHISPGKVIVDVPAPELLLSEPRISKTNVKILDGERLSTLSKISPLANALRKRRVTNWAVMVFCDGKYKNQVSKAAEKFF
ncbi:MAG: HD domain-containing protein [Candidatus Methanofastidiosia archaeon]